MKHLKNKCVEHVQKRNQQALMLEQSVNEEPKKKEKFMQNRVEELRQSQAVRDNLSSEID